MGTCIKCKSVAVDSCMKPGDDVPVHILPAQDTSLSAAALFETTVWIVGACVCILLPILLHFCSCPVLYALLPDYAGVICQSCLHIRRDSRCTHGSQVLSSDSVTCTKGISGI